MRADRVPLPPAPARTPADLQARPRRDHEAGIFFQDPAFRRTAVKVLPGEFYVNDEDVVITTTLGSCVAACLHDPGTGIGGLNHFMLPDAGDAASGARFGAFAMELLINELVRRGARRAAMEARIFGGGQVMKSLAGTLIGDKNVAFARGFLAQEGIPLRGGDVLDVVPRRICMFPRSGLVLCRRLPAAEGALCADREVRYRSELAHAPAGGVELFR